MKTFPQNPLSDPPTEATVGLNHSRCTDEPEQRSIWYAHAMEQLVDIVQQLSLMRDLSSVMEIVRHAARKLTGADGATFVLRDGDKCFYAEEDAISPLWKGLRFPLSTCISGWVMLNRQPAVIEDIYTDPRIPVDVYRKTFVQSLAMVPIRTIDPIGAIGNYWATRHCPTPEQIKVLQVLADTTAVAMENVEQVHERKQAEEELRRSNANLIRSNEELEAFIYSVSHDLTQPLRGISTFAKSLERTYADKLDGKGRDSLSRIIRNAAKMNQLIEGILTISRIARQEISRTEINLGELATSLFTALRVTRPSRSVEFAVVEEITAYADRQLVEVLLANLLANSWKFTSHKKDARIEIGIILRGGETVYYVRDNGIGFDPLYAAGMFRPFHPLHADEEFKGMGVGLAIVERIIHRHGGKVWAEGKVDGGATFYFTLPRPPFPDC